MKITQKIAALAFVMVGFAATANAQTATVEAQATANVIKPISIIEPTNLIFGDVIGTVGGGDVTVDVLGERTGDPALLASGTTTAAASFKIEGEAGRLFFIDLPDTEEIVIPDTEFFMVVNNFQSSLGIQNVDLVGGSVNLTVGATLVIGENQEAGTYAGSFNVVVGYE